MAILNRSTLKQKISDFINRVAPFTDPLIQKSEDLEVREDVADSVIFKESTVGSISSPAANFTVDFVSNDEYNIDTAASIPAAFSITLSNLKNNSIGKLNIIKKSGDVFTFVNGTIIPFASTEGQTGKTSINLIIIATGGSYFVMPEYTYQIITAMLADGSVTNDKIVSIGAGKLENNSVIRDNINTGLYPYENGNVAPNFNNAAFGSNERPSIKRNVIGQYEVKGLFYRSTSGTIGGTEVLIGNLPLYSGGGNRYITAIDYLENPTIIRLDSSGNLYTTKLGAGPNPSSSNGVHCDFVISNGI